MPFIAAVDCGTTLVKAGVLDTQGRTRGAATAPAPVEPGPEGRVEQDPERVVRAVVEALAAAVARAGLAPGDVAALAVSSQRATVVPVGADGAPAGPAISWQDGRGAPQLARFGARVAPARFQEITGLPLNPVFSLGRILWLLDHGLPAATCFVLVHDWVLHRLGVDGLLTDHSNASLTGLLDLRALRWSDEVLDAAGLTPARLPALVAPGTPLGGLSRQVARATGLPEGLPLVAGGGDQQCAALGAGVVAPGRVEVGLGTSGVALAASGTPVVDRETGLMGCVHAVPGLWEVEGFQNSAGAAVDRVTAWTGGGGDAVARALAEVPLGADGVLFLPYLVGGASAPRWDPDATGAFLGLRHHHGPAHLVRAAVEGVCLEVGRVVSRMEALGVPVEEIRATGGCTRIMGWNQALADILGRRVVSLENPDASLVGAAVLAAVGAGLFADVARAAEALVREEAAWVPSAEEREAASRLVRRHESVLGSAWSSDLFRAVKGMAP